MGKIMGKVTPLVKGKADMKVVSEIIKNKLNKTNNQSYFFILLIR